MQGAHRRAQPAVQHATRCGKTRARHAAAVRSHRTECLSHTRAVSAEHGGHAACYTPMRGRPRVATQAVARRRPRGRGTRNRRAECGYRKRRAALSTSSCLRLMTGARRMSSSSGGGYKRERLTNYLNFLLPDDYRLSSGSKCIDAGSNNVAMSAEYDLDGIPRPLDGDLNGTAIVDMGCYETLKTNADSSGGGIPDGWSLVRLLPPRHWL